MEIKANLTKKNGEVVLDKSFDYMCSMLMNGNYIVTIKKKVQPRTIPQNSLMWMWFKCLEDDTGTDKQEWHDYYCNKFLARQASIGGKMFTITGGTSKLNTIQMTEFMNKIQADAAAEFGVTLPLPADRHYQEFISHYKHRY